MIPKRLLGSLLDILPALQTLVLGEFGLFFLMLISFNEFIIFSPDSRWLITSSMDCTIKSWDIPSSYMIDHFRMPQPCISMSMSPTGDFLATAHVDFLGVYLWTNKTLFEHISFRAIEPDSEAPLVQLPSMASERGKLEDVIEDLSIEEDGELINSNYKSPDQLDIDLITMSTLAESKWKNLLSLDIIKQRNKPREPAKKPKQAPFFLPTVAGLDLQFDLQTVQDDESSKIQMSTELENLTIFGAVLKKSMENEELGKPIHHIVNLNPSMIDFEIKSLSPLNGGSVIIMLQFMKVIVKMFQENMHFELAQSYLALFLKLHEKMLVDTEELTDQLDEILVAQERGWKVIEDKLFYGIGVVSNLRNFC